MNENLVIILTAIIGFVAIVSVGFAFAGGNVAQERAIKRAQAITGSTPKDVRRARTTTTAANTPESRRRQIIKSLKEQERQQKKARLTLENKLKQAGLSVSVLQFWLAGGGLGVVVALGLALSRIGPWWAWLGLGAVSAVGLPQWVLGFLAKRRMQKFTSFFSDAMEFIVRGIKSGLPVHDCLKIIARETPDPLREEFQRLVENIGMGMTLDQALEKLLEHMPTAEVRFFAIVMNIQQKTGGNLAEALGNLSAVLRSRKLMREKIKALSSEATASAGIIGSMPPAVILLISFTTPSYMQPMFHDHRGWFMLGISAALMGFGIFVMARMINFKF